MQKTDHIEPFKLPGLMTIDTVEGLSAELKQLQAVAPTVTLDASQTEIITTPGAQLLFSFSKMLEAVGIQLRITEAKPAFAATFLQLGLATYFSQWESN